MRTNVTTPDEIPPDQHALGQSIILHLLPGVLILGAYLALYPLAAYLGDNRHTGKSGHFPKK